MLSLVLIVYQAEGISFNAGLAIYAYVQARMSTVTLRIQLSVVEQKQDLKL